MPKVRKFLALRDLELGPFAQGAAAESSSPWKHWKVAPDENGIAWLVLDKAGASANTLNEEVLTELASAAAGSC